MLGHLVYRPYYETETHDVKRSGPNWMQRAWRALFGRRS